MCYARGVKSERLGVIDITAQSAAMSGQMEKGSTNIHDFPRWSSKESYGKMYRKRELG